MIMWSNTSLSLQWTPPLQLSNTSPQATALSHDACYIGWTSKSYKFWYDCSDWYEIRNVRFSVIWPQCHFKNPVLNSIFLKCRKVVIISITLKMYAKVLIFLKKVCWERSKEWASKAPISKIYSFWHTTFRNNRIMSCHVKLQSFL